MTQGPAPPLLELVDATIGYGDSAVLERVNLCLRAGERVVLLGSSGCGKTTLLRHLHELLLQRDDAVAWIPQQLGLVERLSVFHNVLIGRLDQQSTLSNLRNLIWPAAMHKKAIAALLQSLDMEQQLFSPVGGLSGGQEQRVAIARAMYRHSSILLADEPVSSLDRPLARRTLQMLRQRFGSYVLALHDVELALEVADRIIGIRDGRIALDLPTQGLDSRDLSSLYLAPATAAKFDD